MITRLTILSFLVLLSYASPTGASAPSKPRYGAWGFDLAAMNQAVRPGDNFDQYASGAWLARAVIPADEPLVALRTEMSDRIEARLRGLLEEAATERPSQPVTLSGKIGAFYRAFLNAKRIEALGVTPIQTELSDIRGASDPRSPVGLNGANQRRL